MTIKNFLEKVPKFSFARIDRFLTEFWHYPRVKKTWPRTLELNMVTIELKKVDNRKVSNFHYSIECKINRMAFA